MPEQGFFDGSQRRFLSIAAAAAHVSCCSGLLRVGVADGYKSSPRLRVTSMLRRFGPAMSPGTQCTLASGGHSSVAVLLSGAPQLEAGAIALLWIHVALPHPFDDGSWVSSATQGAPVVPSPPRRAAATAVALTRGARTAAPGRQARLGKLAPSRLERASGMMPDTASRR
jgi:hypothetical protein